MPPGIGTDDVVIPKHVTPGFARRDGLPTESKRVGEAIQNALGADIKELLKRAEQLGFKRREGAITAIEVAHLFIHDAMIRMVAMIDDPDATSAQVKACENIISWGAGRPEQYITNGLNLGGKTIVEAMDEVITAYAAGLISIEASQHCVSLLKLKSDAIDISMIMERMEEMSAEIRRLKGGDRTIDQ
ncbi:hypothetical protein ABGN05_24990 [Aquibium sp. LZ166]|uniref:Uncharacterized protein n=1 Tax=Aquibium pacificus TaxID=3153579 RepID=A0ABV3SQ23_9HYPH